MSEFKKVRGGPFDAELGSRLPGYEYHPLSGDQTLGFRLALGDGSRVRLGGGWDLDAPGARVAYRRRIVPTFCCYNLGFRLARDEEG